uniref:Distal membrane-arm assembly complex protein 1-like domain-containing protein n=1 Tax=Taeniopygia guttata TaxID=59729 RepID=A0A674G8Y9_TAEGU
ARGSRDRRQRGAPRGAVAKVTSAAGLPPAVSRAGCGFCRLLSGTGLLLAALWVYQGPRSAMRSGAPPPTLPAGLGAWAIVILADPVGRRRPEP